MTHVGKIARLPGEVREQLNIRLRNGEQGKLLVKWLNSLPEVMAVMIEKFRGKPVNEPNLSEWKTGGYRDWLTEQDSLAEVRRALAGEGKLNRAAQRGLQDHLGFWVTARYLTAAHKLRSASGGEMEFDVLRALCKDVVALRRGDQRAAHLEIERMKMETTRMRHERGGCSQSPGSA